MIETFETRIEDSQPMLLSIVKRIHKRLPPFILYEDVLSCAQLGLAQAARSYQPQPGAKFATYAYYRITGAVFDGIARMNWSTRSEYRKYKAMQNSNNAQQQTEENHPKTDGESNAKWLVDSVENLSMVYLFSSADSENPIEQQLPGGDIDPAKSAESKELTEKLNAAISKLPTLEQKFIRMVYFEGLSLAEAAEKTAGKSRSWGSRLHNKILKFLGTQMMPPVATG